MVNFIKNQINRVYYGIAAMRNRYACKIVEIKHFNLEKQPIVRYQTFSRFHIYESNLRDIAMDKDLLEKFHPNDSWKIGYLTSLYVSKELNILDHRSDVCKSLLNEDNCVSK